MIQEKIHFSKERNKLLRSFIDKPVVGLRLFKERIQYGFYPEYFKKYLNYKGRSVLKGRNHIKNLIREQYNFTCARCPSEKDLSVRHIKPYRTHPELDVEPSNLILLCGNCIKK